jgi:hypothetical protein
LSTLGVQLFRKLYERQCRRPFAPAEIWEWKDLPVLEFTGQFEGVSPIYRTNAYDSCCLTTAETIGLPAGDMPVGIEGRGRTLLVSLPMVIPFMLRATLFSTFVLKRRTPADGKLNIRR